jgi:hypothetical protein
MTDFDKTNITYSGIGTDMAIASISYRMTNVSDYPFNYFQMTATQGSVTEDVFKNSVAQDDPNATICKK